jgi:putative aldouronate transport system substrate-binding protein
MIRNTRINALAVSVLIVILITSVVAGCTQRTVTPKRSTIIESNELNPELTANPVHSRLKILVPENDLTSRPFTLAERENLPVWKEFQKMLDANNLELEFELIDPIQYDVVMQTRLAAAIDLPDIIKIGKMSDENRIAYVKSGIFQPVSDIINNYCKPETKEYINALYPFLLTAAALPDDGKSYWFAQTSVVMYGGDTKSTARSNIIRYDWLKKLGMDIPTTTDELFQACVAIQKQDANGSGVIGDEKICIKIEDSSVITQFGGYFGLVGDITGAIINGGNKVESCWYQDGMQDFIRYLKLLYDNKILDLISDSAQLNAQNSLILHYGYSTLTSQLDEQCSDEEAAFVAMPILTGKHGIEPVFLGTAPYNFSSNAAFAVTNMCSDLSAPAKFFDILYTDEWYVLSEFGIEGSTWKYDENIKADNFYTKGWRVSTLSSNVNEVRAFGDCNGYSLWGNVFPRITTEDRSVAYYQRIADTAREKGNETVAMSNEEVIKSWGYTKYYPNDNIYAMATEKQNERLDLLLTDLKTYHEELVAALITGKKPIEDWDKYILELKQLGLDEVISINQDRFNRGMYYVK